MKARSLFSVTTLFLVLLLMIAMLCGCASDSQPAAEAAAASTTHTSEEPSGSDDPVDAETDIVDATIINFYESETAIIYRHEDGSYSASLSFTGDYPGLDMAVTIGLLAASDMKVESVVGVCGEEVISVFYEGGEMLPHSTVPASWGNYNQEIIGQYASELDQISQFFGMGNLFSNEYAASTGSASSESSVASAAPSAAKEPEASFESFVAYSQNDITVTFVGLEVDSVWGTEIKVLIENDSDKNITAQVRNTSINGAMIDMVFSCDVAAGKKANDRISFYSSDLELAGITVISEIELSLHIFDSDTWDDIDDSDPILIKTSVDDYTQVFDDSGFVAYEADGLRIVAKNLDTEHSLYGADVLLFIENSTEQNLTIQTRDVSINGFMVDPVFSCDVCSGKVAFDTISFFESDLKDNDITSIEALELRFHIFDSDTWRDNLDSDLVTITFG